jgi:hypothetical protein
MPGLIWLESPPTMPKLTGAGAIPVDFRQMARLDFPARVRFPYHGTSPRSHRAPVAQLDRASVYGTEG